MFNWRAISRQTAALSLGVFVLCGWTGCAEEYDFSRETPERGTLGQELFKVWRGDAMRTSHAPRDRVDMLDEHRRPFVRAVDQVAPPGQLQAIDTFLQKALTTVETGLLPPLTRKVRAVIQEAARDEAIIEGIAGGGRLDPSLFVHPDAGPGLASHLAGFDRFDDAAWMAVDVLLPADGYDAHGQPAPGESRGFLELQRVLADGLLATEQPTGAEEPFALALRDLLMTEDDRFVTTAAGGGDSLLAVRFDRRGYPLVRPDAEGLPFVDRDEDGLVDVDEQGRFVLKNNENKRIAPFWGTGATGPFGHDDRDRITTGDTPVFQYEDLGRSGLHFLLRKTAGLHEQRVLWDMMAAMPAALGPRVERSDGRGNFQGYAEEQPLIDAAHAALNMLAYPKAPETLEALAGFVDDHQPTMARMALAADAFGERVAKYPDASIDDDQTILQDLLPIVEQIAEDPELWADLLEALRDPITLKIDDAMVTLLEHKDRRVIPQKGGPYDRCFQQCKSVYESKASDDHPHGIGLEGRFECIRNCPTDRLFSEKTNFDQPESLDNRSISQRIFHLLRDTSGVEYKLEMTRAEISGINVAALPPLITLPAAAEAFIATIAGNLKVEDYVSQEWNDSALSVILGLVGVNNGDVVDLMTAASDIFGAHLDPEPTPDQITRLFNQADLKFETDAVTIDITDPVCKDGYVMANHHADGLYAAEASGLIDALQPLAKAFSDHGREDLLARFFIVIHRHYSTHEDLYVRKDGSPSPMKGSGFVTYEPALLDEMKDGSLVASLHEIAKSAGRADGPGDAGFEEHLRRMVYHASRTDDGFVGRGGQSTLPLPDGRTLQNPSRAHFLIDALDRLGERVSGDSEASRRFEEAVSALQETFLSVETNQAGEAAFAEPGTLALVSKGSRMIAERGRTMRRQGTLIRTLSRDWPDALESAITSRSLPAMVELLNAVADHDGRRALVNELITHFVGSSEGRRMLASALYQMTVRAAAPGSWVPVAHLLGRALDPDRTWEVDGDSRTNLPLASHVLEVLHGLLKVDPPKTGIKMMRRALTTNPRGEVPLSVLGGLISDYYRVEPGSEAPYDAQDYKRVYLSVAGWLDDDAHGLEQLYDIVEMRR